jgi:restriction system protein
LADHYSDLLRPTVSAVRTLGGSGSIDENVGVVTEQEAYADEQQQVLHGDGPQTEIECRLAWARTYLKFMGLLVNSSRGVWSLTDRGRFVSEGEIAGLHAEALAAMREKQRAKNRARGAKPVGEESDATSDELDWRDQLLGSLMAMPPDGFERLAQRLLREAGFISATVTGRTQRLCDLLKQYELGTRTTTRVVEDITVDQDFFNDLSRARLLWHSTRCNGVTFSNELSRRGAGPYSLAA